MSAAITALLFGLCRPATGAEILKIDYVAEARQILYNYGSSLPARRDFKPVNSWQTAQIDE
ncbi:MAG: hypothetical protein ACI9QL_002385 [Candidatus Omnitrophota bacterium]